MYFSISDNKIVYCNGLEYLEDFNQLFLVCLANLKVWQFSVHSYRNDTAQTINFRIL